MRTKPVADGCEASDTWEDGSAVGGGRPEDGCGGTEE